MNQCWKITYDENMTSARRRKTQGLSPMDDKYVLFTKMAEKLHGPVQVPACIRSCHLANSMQRLTPQGARENSF